MSTSFYIFSNWGRPLKGVPKYQIQCPETITKFTRAAKEKVPFTTTREAVDRFMNTASAIWVPALFMQPSWA